MRNLLAAEFVRLWKRPLLWIVTALALVYPFLMLCTWYHNNQYFIEINDPSRILILDHFLFCGSNFLGYLIAAFVSLFLGAEYASGAIRSKIAVGCSRTSVYLSGLAAAAVGVFVLCFAATLFALAAGAPFYGFPRADAAAILLTLAGTLCAGMAYTALFTAACMAMGRNTAASGIVCALLALAMHYAANQLNIQLVVVNVQGSLRTVCQFLYDLLPAGQMSRFNSMSAERPLHLMGWSLVLSALSTAAGLGLFRRQDVQ